MDSAINTLIDPANPIRPNKPPKRPAKRLGITRSKVGFPIRTCPDQSSFAAPRTLSQRTTSFIASQHQGIHRDTLITLDRFHYRCPSPSAKRRTPQPASPVANHEEQHRRRTRAGPAIHSFQRPFASNASDENPSGQPGPMMHHAVAPTPKARPDHTRADPPCSSLLDAADPARKPNHTTASKTPTGSDAFPLHNEQQPALPVPARKPGTQGKAKPISSWTRHNTAMVEPDGIEPTTSCLQSRRSPS